MKISYDILISDPYFKPFLEKGYGLSILNILLEAYTEQREIGQIELYNMIPVPKPHYPAFREFLTRLSSLDKLSIEQSVFKKSKKSVLLTQQLLNKVTATTC